MKKSSLLLCTLLLVGLTGCSQTNQPSATPAPLPIIGGDDMIEVKPTPTPFEEEVENKDAIVTLTQTKLDKLQEYYSTYNYINFTQRMESGLKNENPLTIVTYSIIADTETKVAQCSISASADGQLDTESSIHDFNSGYTFVKDMYQDGHLAEGKVNILNIDLLEMKNVYDLYQHLLGDVEIPVDVKGTKSEDGLETYEIITRADKSMLSGVSYDRLGNQIITLKGRMSSTFELEEISVEIEYIIGNTTYYCRTVLDIMAVNDIRLLMPDIGIEIPQPEETEVQEE